MNKRFSTLLATALVAGGLSANAADYPVGKYIQLQANSKYLVVGEGISRDSLALIDAPKTLEELNKTLWKLNVTPVKSKDGLVEKYAISLENKVNGPIELTKVGAAADKSLYYAPGAVVASGVQSIAVVDPADFNAETNVITFDFSTAQLAPAKYYDAASKKVFAFRLEKTESNVIKLMTASKDASDVKTQADLDAINPTFSSGTALTFASVAAPSPYDLKADMLNVIGNDAFKLVFSNDITDNAKFTNPFSASELTAVKADVYSSAAYDLKDYEDAVKAANEVVKAAADVKANVAAYVKEVKEALTKNNGAAVGTLKEQAANKDDIAATASMLASTEIEKVFAANRTVAKAVKKLLDDVDTYKYAAVSGSNPAVYQVEGASAKITEVDNLLKAVNKAIEDLNVTAAINKVNDAVAAFAKVAYRKGNETVDYTNYKVGNVAADKKLTELAKGYTDVNKTTLGNLVDINLVKVTKSNLLSGTDNDAGYAFAVVGQNGKYVTVDTAYVAQQEKYLSLNTTALNEVVVKKDDKTAVDVTAKDYKFDANTMEKVLVPALGKLAKPALFTMKVFVDDVATGDSIIINGYAPALVTDKNYYSELTDEDITATTPTQQVVIRTLANSREASILAENEEPDAIKNTKISFEEPKLATLIKDGAIYYVIEKESTSDNVGNYHAAIPSTVGLVYAKNAYANVPGTQFVATKNGNNYSLDNRDFVASVIKGQKLFVVGDEKNMIYTNSARDTFQLVEIPNAKEEYLGYKHISQEVQQISDYVLSAVNYANPEVPFFLTYDGNADSTLVAAKDQVKALTLKAVLKDGKEVTSAYAMNDKSLKKQYYQLVGKSGNDVLYLDINKNNELVVTKVPTKWLLQFRNVNDEANEYEVLIGAYNAVNGTYDAASKISYNQAGQAVAVRLDEATAFVYDLTDNSTDIYKNFGITAPTNVIISLNGDDASKVTSVHPFAVVKRTGLELKAAATDNDFVLGLDTAYVNRKNNIRYAYYITKPIDTEKVGSFDEKGYMVSYNDSIVAKRSNDTVKYEQDKLTRIGFVRANRIESVNNDSLAIAKVKPTKADVIDVAAKKGITPATWAFAIDENNEDAYRIETSADANGNKYVSYLNGILVLGNKEQAQLFNVNTTDLTPTDNEKIATSGVVVVAGEGQVTIAGAAGKKVVVSNVLGQVVANTVLTSDNATIAAPAGVVVVVVEGEEAVKAVVK